ncbi:hypothetical protein MY3296_002161 [Beauveria thailandica]
MTCSEPSAEATNASAEATRLSVKKSAPSARVAASSVGPKAASVEDTTPPSVGGIAPSVQEVAPVAAPKQVIIFPKPSITEIRHHLFIGNQYSSYGLPTLGEYKITAIVSVMDARLTLWLYNTRPFVPEEKHLYVPCADSSTMDMLPFMGRVCDFIEERISTDDNPNVLVHCRAGISRSATIVIAYLMRKYGLSADEALAEVKAKRRVRPNPNFMDQLRVWWAVGFQIWQDGDKTVPKDEYQAYLDRRAVRLKDLGLTGDEPIEMQNF